MNTIEGTGTKPANVVVRGNASGFLQEIVSGAHQLRADEPVAVGGSDAAPGPYDYLLVGLGACTSMTVGLYARAKKWPLENIVGMLPGGSEMLKGANLSKQEKEFTHMEAMICAMTPVERRTPQILNARRRQRIAKGSGVTVTELNTMLNKFGQMQQMMKKMGKFSKMMTKMGGGMPGMFRR